MSEKNDLSWRSVTAVFVGGLAGTGLRVAIDAVAGQPISTLIVNVIGSLVLGFLVARLWSTAAPWVRGGLGAGLLGSFTTFSAVAVIFVDLGVTLPGLGYLAATLVLGLGAAFLGLLLGARS